jgi:hypothetical protein
LPPKQQVALVFLSASRNSLTGQLYLKVVKRADAPQPIHITVAGAKVAAKGQAAIAEPTKIAPVTAPVEGLRQDFTRTFPPYSIEVLSGFASRFGRETPPTSVIADAGRNPARWIL